MESCNSAPKDAVLHVKTTGPIETSNSDARHAVLYAENHTWGLEPIYTSNSSANDAVFHAQNERWGLVPSKYLFCKQKPQMRAGTKRD